MFQSIRELAAAVFLIAAFAACTAPCEELANQICECEPNSTAEEQCIEQVRATMNIREASEAENTVCDAVLEAETCNCDALERGDPAACGLAKR